MVAAGLCDKVLVQVSYAIGVANPTGIYVNTYGTSKGNNNDKTISNLVKDIYDFRPFHIEEKLNLRNPIYSETASYGHMGRKPQKVIKTFESNNGDLKSIEVNLFPWESLDLVENIKEKYEKKNCIYHWYYRSGWFISFKIFIK